MAAKHEHPELDHEHPYAPQGHSHHTVADHRHPVEDHSHPASSHSHSEARRDMKAAVAALLAVFEAGTVNSEQVKAIAAVRSLLDG